MNSQIALTKEIASLRPFTRLLDYFEMTSFKTLEEIERMNKDRSQRYLDGLLIERKDTKGHRRYERIRDPQLDRVYDDNQRPIYSVFGWLEYIVTDNGLSRESSQPRLEVDDEFGRFDYRKDLSPKTKAVPFFKEIGERK